MSPTFAADRRAALAATGGVLAFGALSAACVATAADSPAMLFLPPLVLAGLA